METKLRLTPDETETVITFDNSSKTATVYTCNKTIMKRLAKKEYTLVDSTECSKTFTCPKKCISFRNAVVKSKGTVKNDK